MSDIPALTSRDAGMAICKHFGLENAQVQSDFLIKTAPGALASVTLTIALTADDLAGIARAAGGDSEEAKVAVDAKASEILRRYGAGSQQVSQQQIGTCELRVTADASEAITAIQRLREEVEELRRLAAAKLFAVPAEMIQGEALSAEPDPRLDEIIQELRRQNKQLQKLGILSEEYLCQIARHSKRSADIAEDTAASAGANIMSMVQDRP